MTARTLGRYQLTERLGRGGMGEVWRARDPALRRDVAVKVLRRDGSDKDETLRDDFVQRFLREARAAASLKHPNVVAIHDIGVDEEPYIVMEWVEGAPLRGFIGDTSVPVARRIEWLIEIARALAAAHELGLVHRDVKPDNVMITKDGHAKVLDFGIAKMLGASEDAPVSQKEAPESFRTQQGRIVGTPKYMAPEQLRGDAIDARVDQWAWACVAYELLTGSMPDRDEVPQPISLTMPEVPFDVAAAIVRARSFDPEKRFDTMRALLAAFAVQPSGEVIVSSVNTTKRDPDAPTTTGPVRRSWARVAIVALASFTVASVAVFAWSRHKSVAHVAEPVAPLCTFAMLPDTPLGDLPDHYFAPPQAIAGGLVLPMARSEQGVHVEELVTVTQDAVNARMPPPPPITSGNPTSLFVLMASSDVRHYLVYGFDQAPLVVGRTLANDSLVDVFRLASVDGFRAYEIAGFYSAHLVPPTLEFLAFGNDGGGRSALSSTLRLFGRGTFGQAICLVDAHESIRGLVATTSEHHVAYTFGAGNVVSMGSFSIEATHQDRGSIDSVIPVETTTVRDAHGPFELGEASAHVGRAFEGETFHVVWPELGHPRLRHATLRTDVADAAVVFEEAIDVPTDGSAADLRYANGVFYLAWHDSANVYYGEGPSVRAAAMHYAHVPDAGVSSGPWISPGPKLATWISGPNNVVRRAIVSCR